MAEKSAFDYVNATWGIDPRSGAKVDAKTGGIL